MKLAWCSTIVFLLSFPVAKTAFAESLGDKFKRWALGSEAQAAMIDDFDARTDRLARECRQCHDGSRATHIAVKDAETPLQFSSTGVQVNHPIGMDYAAYAARNVRGFTRRHSLDPNITLIDGRVTCVSCHRLKVTASDALFGTGWPGDREVQAVSNDCSASTELTVGPKQSDLCLACHNM